MDQSIVKKYYINTIFSLFLRIVAFIGSPVEADEKELMRIAKKLKKEKVNLDIVSFGEDQVIKTAPVTVYLRNPDYKTYLVLIFVVFIGTTEL